MRDQRDGAPKCEEKPDYQCYRPEFIPPDSPPQHGPVEPAAGQDDYFLRKAREEFPYLQAMRRRFHQNPELPIEEKETSLYIREELRRLEISYQLVDPYGVVAVIQGCGPGRTAALRADMDALPLQELGETEYRSRRDGCMHACGHDAHTAILLGAAKLPSQNRGRFSGTAKLVFQEAEEIGAGALLMLKSGMLDDCSAIFGLHQSAEYPTGQIFVQEKKYFCRQCDFYG